MLSLLLYFFELLASFICTCLQTNTIENELHFFNACQLSMMHKGQVLLSLGTHSTSQLST